MKPATWTLVTALTSALTSAMPARPSPPTLRETALAFSSLQQLNETGYVVADGKPVPYLIRRLPANAFPGLPGPIAAILDQRGCLIPQTYAARAPENVVRASLEHAGSSDWAVLCSAEGKVSLLVFFASEPDQPRVLATSPETERLQRHGSETWGFNWGIDQATPQGVHDAQSGMEPRPPKPDHDALADSVIEHRTIYHFYANGRWTLLEMPAP